MQTRFDHAALQVTSVQVGASQLFPEEGTRELYVGSEACSGRLLLIEPISAGPYKQSMAKRGPGLHHVALGVESLERFADSLIGSGWLLHLCSLRSMRELRTVWLARPGIPFLVEVSQDERPDSPGEQLFLSDVEIPVSENPSILSALGVPTLRPSTDSQTWLTLEGCRLSCAGLLL
jgi:hypothetical protein